MGGLDWLQDWWKRLRGDRPAPRRRPLPAESTEDYVERSSLAMKAEGVDLRVGVVSTKGNFRSHNEDNFFVPGLASLRNESASSGASSTLVADRGSGNRSNVGPSTAEDDPIASPPGLFIVADGMGGQLAGERASQMAVELIPMELAKRLPERADDNQVLRAFRESIARANEEILAQSRLQTDLANMGTTIVMVLFHRRRAFVAGIGDSRVYHLRGQKLELLTRDHSLANALSEAGTIRPEEVETHKFKHMLYLYLGSKDVGDGPEEVRVIDCQPGDQLLLASDGLTGVVKDEQITEILRSSEDPQRAAQLLVNRALENRSKDNVTCIVVKLV